MRKRAGAILLAIIMMLSISSGDILAANGNYTRSLLPSVERDLTEDQYNSIALLNYFVELTQSISASKNSRLYLEEAYSSIINNIAPNAVDENTQSYIGGLLDTLEKYRMIEVKRARLKYIFEQNQAQALRAAMPNPIGLLSEVTSFDIKGLVSSVVYMAADSYTSYKEYKEKAEIEYLKSNWEFDDEAEAELHNCRKQALDYMFTTARENKIPDAYVLRENSMNEFAECKANDNTFQRIQFLESNESTYKMFGSYWLTLADSYYTNEAYDKCLKAIDSYEEIQARIFMKDHEFARIIPLAIASAKEVMPEKNYIKYASEHLDSLCKNIENDDWALRYFAAETYLDLYVKMKDTEYLEKAYNLTKDNVNHLAKEQEKLNDAYLKKYEDVEIPKNASKAEKNDIKQYNKMMKAQRKVALPPVYEPLALNCELLFKLAEAKGINDSEKRTIDGILHNKGANTFLCEPLDDVYRFTPDEDTENGNIDFNGKEIMIPVSYLTTDSNIKVTVKDDHSTSTYDDWTITKVDRDKDNDISTFVATYASPSIKKQKYEENANVVIEITQPKEYSAKKSEFKFKTVKVKVMKVKDKIAFEQVK